MSVLTASEVIVDTRQGQVRGALVDGVHVFKGIPYAAPPFGPGRFAPPRPVEPWEGVRDALAFGHKSPQPDYPPHIRLMMPEMTTSGEDCLNLNVWTPNRGASNLPVMVWIPGGAFEFHGTGACPWYDGTSFARDGIVCVTIGYRVGAEGFLYLPDGTANLGLLDQIAALEWVRDNIAAFGGDPHKVTVFGESAGALSIGALMAMPRADGLFQRAVIQSGGAHHSVSKSDAQRIGQSLSDSLKVPYNRAALAEVPTGLLLEAQEAVRNAVIADPDPGRWGQDIALSCMPWQPVVDGETLPGRPIDRIAAGASAGVDVLIGTNTDENRLFLGPEVIETVTDGAARGVIGSYGLPVDEAMQTYQSLMPRARPGDILAAVQSDWFFRVPTLRLADARATAPAHTYMYEFAWRTPQLGGQLGACHALEIPFVFNALGHSTGPLLGGEPPQALADTMHRAWADFARNGNPGWPRYDTVTRSTMRFDTTSQVVQDPMAAQRRLWSGHR